MSRYTRRKPDEEGNSLRLRDALFGDMPLAVWGSSERSDLGAPWSQFARARAFVEAEETAQAIAVLRQITETPGLESRHYVQAWHSLRQLGMTPPEGEAKRVYGVVIEVALAPGLDIVAAYADHTAHYVNHSGAAVIWENPTDTLHKAIEAVLDAGRRIVRQIGPWHAARPPAPPAGQARVSLLTPSGLHFGQAPLDVLADDALGGPILAAAFALMQALMEIGVAGEHNG